MNKHTLIKHYLWHQDGRDKIYSENTKFKKNPGKLDIWFLGWSEITIQGAKKKIYCDRIIQRLLQQNYKNYKLPTHQ